MKKKCKRNTHLYSNGGFTWNSKDSFDKNMSGAFNAGALNTGMSALGNIGGNALSGGLSSTAGNVMQGLSGVAGMIPGPIGGVASAGLGILGGITNKLFGSKVNKEAVNNFKNANIAQSNLDFNAGSNDDLLAQSDFNMLGNISKGEVGKDGVFSHKVRNLTRRLNTERDLANQQAVANYSNTVDNVDSMNDFQAMQNMAAYGGFLNRLANGGDIHIKKANRGKFTESANRAGMGVQEFARHILANKDDYSTTQIRRANFARNASKWHALGGPLFSHGSDWSNGLTEINEGGTHEENPYEGVPMGVDEQGNPNLVEEGEVIWNDYVFSNRLKPSKDMKKKYKLGGGLNSTFADAAKYLAKSSEERPNDPIAKRTLNSMLVKLANEQESLRVKKEQKNNNTYKCGGKLYARGGEKPQINLLEGLATNKELGIEDNPYKITPEEVVSDLRKFRGDIPLATYSLPKDNSNDSSIHNYPTWMRYAPALGATIGLGASFKKPDYSNADAVLEAANKVGRVNPIKAHTIGDYLAYNPFDVNYATNIARASNAATRRAIENNSNGNRLTAIAGLTNLNNNYLNSVGNTLMQADNSNLNQRFKIGEYNRGTNMYNADALTKVDMANLDAESRANSGRLSGVAQAMAMRNALDANRSNAINANLTNLFDNIGNIGRENFIFNQLRNNKALRYNYGNRNGASQYVAAKNGGLLTIKKRKRNG